MGNLQKKESGFSIVEIVLVLVVVVLIGVVGYVVYRNYHNSATNTNTSKTAKATTNPYAGWKTYHSIFNSDLSFKYPANWVFTPAPQIGEPNNLGGTENDSVIYNVQPTAKQGEYAAVPTNQYMCVTFDEYSEKGWNWPGNWNQGTIISSQQLKINGQKLTLATLKGATPMQDVIELIGPTNTKYGDQFITTTNGHVVSVSAQFNCEQGGFPANANLNADFNSQPETVTAKLIIESVNW